MRRPGGALICTSADGRETHQDTYTCIHCNGIVVVGAKQRPEDIGFCNLCFAPTCARCAAKGSCDHFEKKLERVEARGRALRSYGLNG